MNQKETAFFAQSAPQPVRFSGMGRLLITVYALLALAALGRSAVQIVRDFPAAPVAYTLSAFSAVIYLSATVALLIQRVVWRRIAWLTISTEMVGVLVVGFLSLAQPELFAHPSVWSHFGAGYLFIPLVLPVLGMLWLLRNRPERT